MNKSCGGTLKFGNIVIGAALSVPLFFGIAISVAAAPASAPLTAPVNSFADREATAIKDIKTMQNTLMMKSRNLPQNAVEEIPDTELKKQFATAFDDMKMDIAINKAYLETELSREHREILEDNRLQEGEEPAAWVSRISAKYGVAPHPSTKTTFSEDAPCLVENGGADGCVILQLDMFHRSTNKDVQMFLNHRAVGDAFVLVHEIGHTWGIMDECAADQYARSYTGLPGGNYCR